MRGSEKHVADSQRSVHLGQRIRNVAISVYKPWQDFHGPNQRQAKDTNSFVSLRVLRAPHGHWDGTAAQQSVALLQAIGQVRWVRPTWTLKAATTNWLWNIYCNHVRSINAKHTYMY